jgi:hypothetical protein
VIFRHRGQDDQALQAGLLELHGANAHGLVEQDVAILELRSPSAWAIGVGGDWL